MVMVDYTLFAAIFTPFIGVYVYTYSGKTDVNGTISNFTEQGSNVQEENCDTGKSF